MTLFQLIMFFMCMLCMEDITNQETIIKLCEDC
jgi:hypothetical protein